MTQGEVSCVECNEWCEVNEPSASGAKPRESAEQAPPVAGLGAGIPGACKGRTERLEARVIGCAGDVRGSQTAAASSTEMCRCTEESGSYARASGRQAQVRRRVASARPCSPSRRRWESGPTREATGQELAQGLEARPWQGSSRCRAGGSRV